MKSTTEFKVTCPFCGEVRYGKTITDDGCDWMGHQRGPSESRTEISKCTCEFGHLVNTMPKIKPMCRNCRYYVGGYCTNQTEIEYVKSLAGNFDIKINKFSIKDPDIACEKHELEYKIFDELFKDEK